MADPAGRWDWIARADVYDVVRRDLALASAAVRRLCESLGVAGPHRLEVEAPPRRGALARGGRLLRRLRAAVGGLRRRPEADVAEALGKTLAALEAALDWQRSRTAYLEALIAMRARAGAPRPFCGAEEEPVILLGAGGGGTRVLAEAAASLGVFLGRRVNESFDSVEWAPLVYALVGEAGARPDLPRGDGARARILETARAIWGPFAAEGALWGWKLPETMLVLPLFLNAFPRARLVWLLRHPVLAALRRPHLTASPGHPIGKVVLRAAYAALGRDPGAIDVDPPHLRSALIWRFQVERVHRFLEAEVPAERVLRVRFEDLYLNPRRTWERLAAFLGAPPPPLGEPVRLDAARLAPAPAEARAREVAALTGEVAAAVGYAPGWLDAPCEEPERRAAFAAARA